MRQNEIERINSVIAESIRIRANNPTLNALLGVVDGAGKSVGGNLGDFQANANLQTLLDVIGGGFETDTKDLYTRLYTESGAYIGNVACPGAPIAGSMLQVLVKNIYERANNKNLDALLGVDDAAGKSINGNIGDFQARTVAPEVTLMDVLGIPDNGDGSLYERLGAYTDAASLKMDVDAVLADTIQIADGTLPASPVAGSLARFLASGGTALGTPLPDSKSLYDALALDRWDVRLSAVRAGYIENINNAELLNISAAILARIDEDISAAKTLTAATIISIRESVCEIGDPATSIGRLLFDNLNAPVGSIPTTPTLQATWTDIKAGYLTGDSYVRLGAPAGADVSADIASIRGDLERLATKQITLGLGAVPVTEALFTVTGEVEVIVVGYIDVGVTGGGGLTLEVGVATATAGLIAQTAVGNLLIDLLWVDATPAVLVSKPSHKVIANGADIIHTIAGAAATAGQITYYCWWRPLSSDGAVVAV